MHRRHFSKQSSRSSLSDDDTLSTASSSDFSGTYHCRPQIPEKHLYVAMDCEMVAVRNEFGGDTSVCARVVLVNWRGRKLLDTYIRPTQPVTDYRTFVSGITEAHLRNAPHFAAVRLQVREILRNRILVGHGLENDLAVLDLQLPWWMIRDTAYYPPFMRTNEKNQFVPRKLRDLAQDKLGRTIQTGNHCPREDAKAALDLYKTHRPRWEACVVNQWQRMSQQPAHVVPVAPCVVY